MLLLFAPAVFSQERDDAYNNWYSIIIYLAGNAIFNGNFMAIDITNSTNKLIQNFYDSKNQAIDIFANNNYNYGDNILVIHPNLTFTVNGTNINPFDYIGKKNVTKGTSYYQLFTDYAGNFGVNLLDNNGRFLSTIANFTVQLARLPGPPGALSCFNSGAKILTDKGYKPIQSLRKGDLVKTLNHDFKAISMIGKREICHPASKERMKDQLYKCGKEVFEEVFEDLIITGRHSLLVDSFSSAAEMANVIEVNGDTYVTDNKYRLPVCCDERACVYEVKGNYTIYHFALENADYYMNYGIYANGLLVESCSKRYLKELSGMILLE